MRHKNGNKFEVERGMDGLSDAQMDELIQIAEYKKRLDRMSDKKKKGKKK